MEDADIPLVGLKLPFNAKMQRACLGYILTSEKFYRQCRLQVKPEWFSEQLINGKIYAIQLKLGTKLGRWPKIEEVRAANEIMAEPLAEQRKIIQQIEICCQETSEIGLDFIRSQLTDWLVANTYRNVIQEAEVLYNQKQWDKCANLFRTISKNASSIRFDEMPAIQFDNFIGDFEQSIVDRDTALTTGLKTFDRALIVDGKAGGLIRGDTTLLIAPSNVGKTTCMITMIRHNLVQGKRILFMTHEGRPEDIRDKLWCAILKVTKTELYDLYRTPEGLKRIQLALKAVQRFLTYIPYNKPGACVEDVEPIIRRAQEDLQAKNNGRGYDLLVVDYPAKLSTRMAQRGNMPRREIDRLVYDYYVQLSLEYGFHTVYAIQTNREGSKVNNGKEDRLLTKEDVAEAWGPVEISSNIITMNRSPDAKLQKRVTFFIDKSRSSETGIAIVCRSRYDLALTHADEFGSIHYEGTSSMEDKIGKLLDQLSDPNDPEKANVAVPRHHVR